MTNGRKRDRFFHRFLSKIYLTVQRISPGTHYWLYSFYQPIKRFFFVLRYPNVSNRGPKVLLVRGEEGPDKLWSYISVYAVYRTLRKVFDVELLVYASFRKRHVRKIVNARPDLVSLGDDSGRFQELFEKHNVPLMGSDSKTCKTGYDKIKAKKIVSEHGVDTPPWHLVKSVDQVDSLLKEVALPVVVKPRMGGSSVCVCKANTKEELDKA
ncbi:MAG: hypothetical protein JRJ47_13765, partial [Deltaproteobacteria bacterium]|nr:hypothetical protein [Deltaproteobacteria bacterium]